MALQPPRYTPEQRAAIIAACLDSTPPMTAAGAARAAAAGTLRATNGEVLPAFDMNPATARAYVSAARRKRARAIREAQGPEVAAREIIGDVLEVAARHAKRLKGKQRAGKLTSREVRDAAAMARETLALARAASTDAPPPQDPTTQDTGDDAGALAAAAAEIARESDPPPEPPAGEAEAHSDHGSPTV